MYIFITVILVILDQITKNYAVLNFKGQQMVELIPNWLYLTYLENKGAAFGFLNDKPMFFTILATIVVVFLITFSLKYRNNLDRFYKLFLAIIIAGALGNLIDRFRYGFVVDFIFSPLGGIYNFPVFNFADIYLTASVIAMIVYILFVEGKTHDSK